jgi:hypothetical protein
MYRSVLVTRDLEGISRMLVARSGIRLARVYDSATTGCAKTFIIYITMTVTAPNATDLFGTGIWNCHPVEASWNVMAHAQKPDFVFRCNGQVHLNRQGRQFSRLLAAKVWASAVVMLDTPRSEVVWRILPIHSIRQFPLRFPSRASPCAVTIQLVSTTKQVLASCPAPSFPFVFPHFFTPQVPR